MKHISKFFITAASLSMLFSLTCCGNNVAPMSEFERQTREIYESGLRSGSISGLTYEEWLESIKGQDGKDGHSPVVEIKDGYWYIDGVNTGVKASVSIENDQGLAFYLQDDGTYAVGAGNSILLSNITIPSSYHEKDVTKIIGSGFEGNSNLKSITIPNSIVTIGELAFEDCTSLTSITIPNTVTTIGGSVFYNCTSLASITIPSSVTSISGSMFSNCTSLVSVNIPNTVTTINSSAFYNCTSLSSIIIPDSVTSIEYDTFNGCSSLASITIPDSVTSIGYSAFSGCTSLASITIPDSITSIGARAFEGCEYLVEVINKSSLDIVVGNEDNGYIAYYALSVITDESQSKIKYNDDYIAYGDDNDLCLVKYIGNSKDLILSNNFTSIGKKAFYNCDFLTSITIPDSVISIGDDAFNGCHFLKVVEMPNSITEISKNLFRDCYSLYSITIPESVTKIGEYSFLNCKSLISIEIPKNISEIGKNAFYYCYKLVEVINKSSLDIRTGSQSYGYVASNALQVITDENDSKLSKDESGNVIYKDDSYLRYVGYQGLDNTVNIPEGVTSIYSNAFYYQTSLTSISIPNTVASIGNYSFYYCNSLESIFIPNSVASIGEYAFSHCGKLTIYCEVETAPKSWNQKWNNSSCPVVWGYKPE